MALSPIAIMFIGLFGSCFILGSLVVGLLFVLTGFRSFPPFAKSSDDNYDDEFGEEFDDEEFSKEVPQTFKQNGYRRYT